MLDPTSFEHDTSIRCGRGNDGRNKQMATWYSTSIIQGLYATAHDEASLGMVCVKRLPDRECPRYTLMTFG
jgi:hypothetical protein